MKKRWLLVGVMLLAALLVVGCGIPQEEHDTVVDERDAAQAQATTLQSDLTTAQGDLVATESDLTTAQSQISSLQSDLTAAQSEIEGLEGKLSTAQGDYDALKEKVAKTKLYGEILEKYYFVAAFEITTEEELSEFTSMVGDTDDTELMLKWTTYLASGTEENRVTFYFAVWDGLWELLQ